MVSPSRSRPASRRWSSTVITRTSSVAPTMIGRSGPSCSEVPSEVSAGIWSAATLLFSAATSAAPGSISMPRLFSPTVS